MNRLTPLETEAQTVLVILLDYMGAGHQKLDQKDHMALLGHIRDCVQHLTNKEYGCDSGKHAGRCDCKGEINGHSLPSR